MLYFFCMEWLDFLGSIAFNLQNSSQNGCHVANQGLGQSLEYCPGSYGSALEVITVCGQVVRNNLRSQRKLQVVGNVGFQQESDLEYTYSNAFAWTFEGLCLMALVFIL